MANEPRTSGVFSLGALGGDVAASVDLLLVGAGSARTLLLNSQHYASGGNGGSIVRRTSFAVRAGTSYAITVGTGATSINGGSSATESVGANGGATSFGVLTAAGGVAQQANHDAHSYAAKTTADIDGTVTSYSAAAGTGSFAAASGSGAGGSATSGAASTATAGAAYVYQVNGTTVNADISGGTNWNTSASAASTVTGGTPFGHGGEGGYNVACPGGDGVVYVAYPTGTVSSYTWSGAAGDLDVDTATVTGYTVLRFTGNGTWTPATAAATRPARRWGGMTGRSLVASTAAVAGDANWSSVVQLFDGAASGSTLTDKTNANNGTLTYNATATGDADDNGAITAQPNGTSLVKFDTTGGYVDATASSDFAFGTGAFTVETWVYITQTPTNGYGDAVLDTRTSAAGAGILLAVTPSMKLDFYSGAWRSSASTSTLSLTTWHHIALTRDASNNWTTYVDGIAHSASTYVTDLTQNNCFWGAVFDDGGSGSNTNWRLTGYMADMRVTKGVARDIAADWAAGVYSSALPQGAPVAASTNVPTTGVLSLAEDYQTKL